MLKSVYIHVWDYAAESNKLKDGNLVLNTLSNLTSDPLKGVGNMLYY